MATVVVRQPATATTRRHPTAVIVSVPGNRKVALPYAPTGGEIGGMGWDWVPMDRSGRKPLLLRGASRLRTLRYTLRLLHRDPQQSVEPTIEALRGLVDSGERVRMTGMGPQERGLYRPTIESITVLARQDGSNAATEAEVSLVLVEASDATTSLGPLTGGARTVASRPAPAPVTPGVPKAVTSTPNAVVPRPGATTVDTLIDVLTGRG